MNKITIKSESNGNVNIKEIEVDDKQLDRIKNKFQKLKNEQQILYSYMRGEITREECERNGIRFVKLF